MRMIDCKKCGTACPFQERTSVPKDGFRELYRLIKHVNAPVERKVWARIEVATDRLVECQLI